MPALAVQDFFFGATPVSAGLDFLTGFANQIQTPAGGGFSVINTYVNMAATDAINPNSSFGATYGLSAISSEMTFFVDVYAKIFGTAPTQGAINNYFNVQTFNLPNGTTITGTTFDFYKEYVRESLPASEQTTANLENGARGAVVGTLLYLAENTTTNQWAIATNNYLTAAATYAEANGNTTNWTGYGQELLANFGTSSANASAATAHVGSTMDATVPLTGIDNHHAAAGT